MVTFDNIAGGALAERFSMALAQIGRNIMDPNMDPKVARGMTIDIKFIPSAAGTISVEYIVKTKLAPMAKEETVFLIGQDARTGRIEINEYGNNRAAAKVVAVEAVQEQPDFDPETGEIYGKEKNGPIDLRAAGRR